MRVRRTVTLARAASVAGPVGRVAEGNTSVRSPPLAPGRNPLPRPAGVAVHDAVPLSVAQHGLTDCGTGTIARRGRALPG
ncbi:hypothetical protein GCM10010360_75960 [Streptomyces nogalater]